MNIIEYINQPEHPWLNLEYYTGTQITMFFIGSVFWLICYIDTLYDIKKKKTVNIPVGCVVTNYGWEIATCLFFVPNMGLLLVCSYWAWMFLDTFIFASCFRYGHKQMMISFFKKNIRFFLSIGIVISLSTQATYMVCGFDIPMAAISGDIINLYMSAAFLYLLFVPGYEGTSMLTAWSKFLGTGIINVMFYLRYPDNYFVIAIGASIAALDILYIVLLQKKINKKLATTQL